MRLSVVSAANGWSAAPPSARSAASRWRHYHGRSTVSSP